MRTNNMRKRLFAAVVMVALAATIFIGCETTYTPDPQVEQFLNTGLTASSSYDAVATASYIDTKVLTDLQGNELGVSRCEVTIDKTNADNLSLVVEASFSGSYVENGIISTRTELALGDDGYIRTVKRGEDVKRESLTEQIACDYIRSFFYMNNDAYDEGGLYYGDFFMLNIYKYQPLCFSVVDDGEACRFYCLRHIDDGDIGKIALTQDTKINKLGLIISNSERYESEQENTVLSATLTASYTYFE